MLRNTSRHIAVGASLALLPLVPAPAQVIVAPGETLTEADLNAGVFNGQPFTLAPGTIFDIGGVLGPVGDPSAPPTGRPFDFQGSTIRVNFGGVIAAGSVVSDAVIGLFGGGGAANGFATRAGSRVTFLGGITGDFASALDSFIVINSGGYGRGFTAGAGTQITINGGGISNGFTAINGAEITVNGGVITDFAEVRSGSTLNVAGGAVERQLRAFGATVNLSAGAIGEGFGAFTGAAVNITGGSVSAGFSTDSRVTIAGGSIADGFSALMDSRVELLVQGLSIDGAPVALTPGQELVITQRGGALLEATLADGSFLDFTLNSVPIFGQDFFDIRATLTARLAGTIPAPGAAPLLLAAACAAPRRRRTPA
ncbi:MAG: hypothetical protein D6692_00200 [Planctomycetota bacterium]|nr:MAG: hypothetical protein D6692_00200 [Planctomycetota bacterium]